MKIDLQNYEEWMVTFMDGELSQDELLAFHEFLAAHPDLQTELDSYEAVKFDDKEGVVFENKEMLYKKAGALVFLKKAWPLAAAIILGIAIWPFIQNKTEELPVVTQENKVETKKTEVDVKEENLTQVEKEILVEPKQVTPAVVMAQQPHTKTESAPALVSRKQKKNVQQLKENIKEEYVDVPNVDVQEREIQKIPESKIIDRSLKEVVLVKEKKKSLPEPKAILTPNFLDVEEEEKALLVISADSHPVIYEKLNAAVNKVETKLETIKEIKQTPITVCIGKRKLFTINN